MAKKRKTPSKSTQANKKLARYRQAFDELDVTEDGELSAAELHTAMREKGLKLSLSSTLSMMSDADANGDNSISFEEFTNVMDSAATFKASKAWTTAVRVCERKGPTETRTPAACSQWHSLLPSACACFQPRAAVRRVCRRCTDAARELEEDEQDEEDEGQGHGQ